MPAGLGVSPVGVCVAGYGSNDVSPVQQQTILIDADTGLPQGARKIDPSTGEYLYDTYGRIQGMSGVQQLVLLRGATLLNSSAVSGLGLARPSGVAGKDYVRRLQQEVFTAMKDLTDNKTIEILEVTVEAEGSRFRRNMKWVDLTTFTEQVTKL